MTAADDFTWEGHIHRQLHDEINKLNPNQHVECLALLRALNRGATVETFEWNTKSVFCVGGSGIVAMLVRFKKNLTPLD